MRKREGNKTSTTTVTLPPCLQGTYLAQAIQQALCTPSCTCTDRLPPALTETECERDCKAWGEGKDLENGRGPHPLSCRKAYSAVYVKEQDKL